MVWLDNSRTIAVFAVVFLHVAAGVVLGNEVGSEYWWIGNLYDSAVRWCVPVFVMISGALLLDPNKEEPITTFYKKRISRILMPIIAWSLAYLTWVALKTLLSGREITVADLATRLLSGKPYYHMWFLYMILGLYLFVPFFRMVTRLASKKEILLLTGIAFLISATNYAHDEMHSTEPGLFISWFLSYIPYFFAGYLVRIDDNAYPKALLWLAFFASVALTSYGCYMAAEKAGLAAGLYFYGYLSITVIPMSISAIYLLKATSAPPQKENLAKKLSALTLGVYLVHPMVLEIMQQLGFGVETFHVAISIPIVSSAVFLVSLIITEIIERTPYLRRTI